MDVITGIKSSPRKGLWPTKFSIQSAQRLFNLRFSERSGEKLQVETFVVSAFQWVAKVFNFFESSSMAQ